MQSKWLHLVAKGRPYLPIDFIVVAVVVSGVAPDGDLEDETWRERETKKKKKSTC